MSVASPRACSSVTLSRNSSPKISRFAPLSFRMKASSSGTSRQLSGTTTAPILARAKYASVNSALFISSSATRSPFSTPAATKALAMRLHRAFNSANVRRTSRSPST